MVTEKQLSSINQNLRGMLDEMMRQKENPRIIQLTRHLIALTSDDSQTEEKSAETALEKPKQLSEEKPKDCKHQNLTPFGVCKDCGKCQHTNIHNQTGDCITCGEHLAS